MDARQKAFFTNYIQLRVLASGSLLAKNGCSQTIVEVFTYVYIIENNCTIVY